MFFCFIFFMSWLIFSTLSRKTAQPVLAQLDILEVDS